MLLTFSHRNTYNLFRRMTLLISYSPTGTRIKIGGSEFRVPVPEFVNN